MDSWNLIHGMCLGGLATFTAPLVLFARVRGRRRLVFVLLRGGFDGLAAVVPVGDPDYRAVRGRMAYEPAGLVPLADGFALAPGLTPLKSFWDAGELVAVQAMAIPYRTRSHFEGQAILETGLGKPKGASDGWLNRLLQVMDGERAGIAVAAGLPRSMSGPHPVFTWSPVELGAVDDGYLDRLHFLYQRDPHLHDRFEAGLQIATLAAGTTKNPGGTGARTPRGGGAIGRTLEATARLLGGPGGPNVAAVEFGGWDTHANQGVAGGRLDGLLGQLARGLVAFKRASGEAWADTTVVVMTEFGRTARPNGTGGTDHGTAGAGFVLGPTLRRSAVLANWPGLSGRELFEGRDLRPTLDTRALLKDVVAGVFDLTSAQTDRVFPGSDAIRPIQSIMS